MGQENQTQKTIEFNTVGRKTRFKDHIWAKTLYGISTQLGDPKTIYGIQHSGTGKPNKGFNIVDPGKPNKGFNTVDPGKSNKGFNTKDLNPLLVSLSQLHVLNVFIELVCFITLLNLIFFSHLFSILLTHL